MGWITGILTFILVLVCLFLSLLILAQKPKKDTGGGLAFGGAASDALFGAGSGDMFTKLTKYFSITFFVLVLLLSLINAQASKRRAVDPRQKVSTAEKQELLAAEKAAEKAADSTPSAATSAPVTASATTAAAPGLLLTATNPLALSTGAPPAAPAAPAPSDAAAATNAAPKPDAERK